MTYSIRRRQALQHCFISALALGSSPLTAALGNTGRAGCIPGAGRGQLNLQRGRLTGLGPLAPVNALGIALPNGFTVRKLAQEGQRVPTPAGPNAYSDYRWHTFPDGGAVIPKANGGWVYSSNSEVPWLPLGGCGALSFNAQGAVEDAYSILSGTTQNCAGGATPWKTWISCEEAKDGLCWECDPFVQGQGAAKPSLGRFAHEAVAVDDRRQAVYLTEDIADGRFYRWTAAPEDVDDSGRMALESGTLEVMNIRGFDNDCYPAADALVQARLNVAWAPVSQVDQRQDKVRAGLRSSGKTVPGTVFAGGEGLWLYRPPAAISEQLRPTEAAKPVDALVFWTTKIDNRIWVLDVANQLVELIFDNEKLELPIDSVDNLCVSPWGDILVAEDPPKREFSRLMVVEPNAGASALLEIHHSGSEICGPDFSPDGSRLYFSSQRYERGGATFEVTLPKAIWAPQS